MEWCIFRCYSLNAGRLFVHYYSYYYSFACNVLCTISNSQSDKQYRMLVCKFVLAHFCLYVQPCALIYLVKFHSTAFLSPWPFVIRPFVRFPPSFLSSFYSPGICFCLSAFIFPGSQLDHFPFVTYFYVQQLRMDFSHSLFQLVKKMFPSYENPSIVYSDTLKRDLYKWSSLSREASFQRNANLKESLILEFRE